MYCLRKQDPDIFGIKEFKIKIVVKHSFFFLFFILYRASLQFPFKAKESNRYHDREKGKF